MVMTIAGGHEAYKLRTELAAAKVPVILAPLTTSSALVGPESSDVIWNQPGLLHKAGIPFALSGGHPVTQSSLTLGDLSFRQVDLGTAGGNIAAGSERSQPRP